MAGAIAVDALRAGSPPTQRGTAAAAAGAMTTP
jgi:hypothetical protein